MSEYGRAGFETRIRILFGEKIMNNIAVKNKTELSTQCQRQDILALYGVPSMVDNLVKKEKSHLFNMLNPCFVCADTLNEISHADGFTVNIPKGMEEALKKGFAHLDKSSKDLGAFTPNIRINGETGIKGQLTISRSIDSQAVTRSLSNLAQMAMLQNVISKLDAIAEKQDEILKGQENDRIGKIIGSFEAFKDFYADNCDNIEEQGYECYLEMQEGLAQLLLQIDEERQLLEKMPHNHWQVIIRSLTFRSIVKPEKYKKFVYDIQIYCRLLLLADVVLLRIGKEDAIRRNHEKIEKYCSDFLNNKFRVHMNFLMNGHTSELDNIHRFNQYRSNALIEISQNGLPIECRPEDIKLLKYNEYEP